MPVINRKFKSGLCHASVIALLALTAFACRSAGKENPDKPRPAAGSTSTPAPALISTNNERLPTIVAFGDSLTAGYGLSEDQAFTTLLQRKLDEKGYRYRVVNAGVSGDTSAGGLRRIDWSLEGDVRFLILELGGNDGLRGLPVAEMKKNLGQIIERAQSRGVTVILAGIEAPPNMGADYASDFRQAFRDLAKQYKVTLIPFVLEGVGGRPEMNQQDGIHPNAAGEKVMTENVWRALEPMIKKN
jgi:acyl-CoA thioesterase-1